MKVCNQSKITRIEWQYVFESLPNRCEFTLSSYLFSSKPVSCYVKYTIIEIKTSYVSKVVWNSTKKWFTIWWKLNLLYLHQFYFLINKLFSSSTLLCLIFVCLICLSYIAFYCLVPSQHFCAVYSSMSRFLCVCVCVLWFCQVNGDVSVLIRCLGKRRTAATPRFWRVLRLQCYC